MTFGGGDEWSDIDVAFGIAEGITPEAVLDDCLIGELQRWDPNLCARLSPLLHKFSAP
jgi:hypothetical protein